MEETMKIRSLAPWFGAKRTLAKQIIAEFGEHNCYWEPMCGSCAVLLAKDPVAAETVCDLHGGITRCAQLLRDPIMSLRLYQRLFGTLACEAIWRESVDYLDGQFPAAHSSGVDDAYHYLVASWLARNGYAGSTSPFSGFAARFSATGGTPSGRWRAVVDSIPAWHERLRNVTILNRDCFEVIERIADATGTVIYLDPPYIEEGGRYQYNFLPQGHTQLAQDLKRFKRARVLVSYYDCKRVRDLYDGWTFLQLEAPKFLEKSGQRQPSGEVTQAPEVLVINGPSYSDPQPSLWGDL
jgi:DNA adenine methylase